MATSILQKFLDADLWAAEDTIVGRLGMVMHTAFLFAGFQPYGAQPPSGYLLKQASPPVKKGLVSTVCLCRWYTAQELSHRSMANDRAEAAVLMLGAQGSDIALLVFLVAPDGNLRKLYRELLDSATVAPVLSGSMADTEPRGSRICRELSDAVCWPLLVDLCYHNGVPLTSSMFSPDGLLSMPDDIKAEILGKLTDGVDLARVACTCRELKQVVSGCEYDAQLWKPLYEALDVHRRRRSPWHHYDWFSGEGEAWAPFLLRVPRRMSWKQKYVEARRRPWDRICRRVFLCDYYSPAFSGKISCLLLSLIAGPPEPETVPIRGEEYMYTTGSHRARRERSYCKKRKGHGTGVIHSASSRYRWKYR